MVLLVCIALRFTISGSTNLPCYLRRVSYRYYEMYFTEERYDSMNSMGFVFRHINNARDMITIIRPLKAHCDYHSFSGGCWVKEVYLVGKVVPIDLLGHKGDYVCIAAIYDGAVNNCIFDNWYELLYGDWRYDQQEMDYCGPSLQ